MPKDFLLPDLGEGIAEAQVVRLLVKPGDQVQEDQGLMEVETDKAAVEIPSPYTGVASKVHVKEGQTVNVGDVIVTFEIQGQVGAAAQDKSGASAAASKPPPVAKQESARAAAPAAALNRAGSVAPPPVHVGPAPFADGQKTSVPPTGRTNASAAPAVRKRAREIGIDIDGVSGTGAGGRVTMEDLERHGQQMIATRPEPRGAAGVAPAARAGTMPAPPPTRAAMAPIQPPPGQPDHDKWGSIRRAPLTQIRKTIAAQMTRSATIIPHVTHADEADVTRLDLARKELNEFTGGEPKLTVTAFVIRAICLALRRYPIFNSTFDEEAGQTIYKDYINIGVAVDSPRGLIVPVIRDADRLSLIGVSQALQNISERIRSGQFAIEDLRGGSFTITNVGALGGTFSTPIINYPEVAILGIGRARSMAMFRDGAVVPAMMLPLNMSFDHRAADGADAARFTRDVIEYLEKPVKFLLD